MRQRGATLGTTLMVAGLILLLGLTAAGTGIFHLNFGLRVEHAAQATEAADAAIALCLERLLTEEKFDTPGDPRQTIEVKLGGSSGVLTFSPSEAEDLGIPPSLNNRAEEGTVEGWKGRTLPPGSLQLIAVGRSGNVSRTVETVVTAPRFPYAIGAEGKVTSRGGLLIGSVESPEALLDGLDPEEMQPADLRSNALGVGIDLNGEVTVSGNLESVGSIALGNGVNVQGEVRPHASQTELPDIDLEEFLSKTGRLINSSELHDLKVTGSRKWLNERMVVTGGLALEEGVLLVEGDLVVYGGVSGRGAIVARGSVTIHQGASLTEGDEQVALLAGGDVTVLGTDQDDQRSSFFQGVLYTEGNLRAENVTLLGLFLAGGKDTAIESGGNMELKNVRALGWENASHVVVEKHEIPPFNLEGSTGSGEGQTNMTPPIYSFSPTPEQLEQILAQIEAAQDDSDKEEYIEPLAELLKEAGLTVIDNLDRDPGFPGTARLILNNPYPFYSAIGNAGRRGNYQPGYIFDLNLNRFLKDSDKIRIMLWEQH